MKKIYKGVLAPLAVLFILLMSGQVYAGSAKVFIFHSGISSAGLGAPSALSIQVFPSSVDQSGSGTALAEGSDYSIDRNVEYEGETNSIYLDIFNNPTATAYVLLKGDTRYAIISASTPDIPGDDQTPAVTSYVSGRPYPPLIGEIATGFETAKVLSFTYSSLSNYAGVSIEVTGPGLSGITSHDGKITSYAMGEYVDNRILKSGETYTFKIKGRVNGVDPDLSLWNEKLFTMEAGGGAQSYILTFEAGADGKPGINFFSMPVPPSATGTWYAETLGETPVPLGEITNAYQLVMAINSAAGEGAQVVSTFGRWDNRPAEQKDAGILILNNAPGGVRSALEGITLKQGEGYQVYVTQKVSLRIKNTR